MISDTIDEVFYNCKHILVKSIQMTFEKMQTISICSAWYVARQ